MQSWGCDVHVNLQEVFWYSCIDQLLLLGIRGSGRKKVMRDYTIPYTWSSKYFKKSLSVRCVANICCVRKWFAFCASISAISAETPELYAIGGFSSFTTTRNGDHPLGVASCTIANEDCSSRRPCQWRLRTAYRDQHSRKSSPARNFNMHNINIYICI